MSDTMQNTWEKFQKETQEPNLCGACGQYYEENQQGEDAYHAPELCDANDEIAEDLHSAILEDISHVIAKHLPRFDNNITPETWKLLELFADETISQLTDPALNCECGYKH